MLPFLPPKKITYIFKSSVTEISFIWNNLMMIPWNFFVKLVCSYLGHVTNIAQYISYLYEKFL